jgi:hypothetical protein
MLQTQASVFAENTLWRRLCFSSSVVTLARALAPRPMYTDHNVYFTVGHQEYFTRTTISHATMRQVAA